MPTDALIIRPGRRLAVELDLPAPLVAGRRVWFEIRTVDGTARLLAADMTSGDQDVWHVEFSGAATALVQQDGEYEASAYTAGQDDVERLADGPTLVRPAIARPA